MKRPRLMKKINNEAIDIYSEVLTKIGNNVNV